MVSLLACWQESTGTPRPFRYSVNPSSKVTCFEPKALPENLEKLDLRASMFGAVFLKKFNVLPKSGMSSIVWEAACFFLGCYLWTKRVVWFMSLTLHIVSLPYHHVLHVRAAANCRWHLTTTSFELSSQSFGSLASWRFRRRQLSNWCEMTD